ncbi:Arc family DNA-binding protein [Agrobacterium sp. CMT1]|uniref:Arc family DNA-binding protein n=1 Tax=Agrobacterium sp. CMT1 TaxID=3128901 RepID=UPI0030786B6E
MKQNIGRGSDQFNLRFPDGMRERIAREAEKSGRSMNTEIVSRLEFTLDSHVADEKELRSLVNQVEEYKRLLIEKINNQKGQTALFKSACHHILSYGDDIPPELIKFAEEMLSIYSVEASDIAADVEKS